MRGAFLLSSFLIAGAANAALVQEWVQRYDGEGHGDDVTTDMALGPDGSVFVAGSSVGTEGSPYEDYLTIKYSPSGVALWTNRYDGPAHGVDRPVAVAVDQRGNAIVVGASDGGFGQVICTLSYSVDGLPMWTNRFHCAGSSEETAQAIAVDASGDLIVVGCSFSTGDNDYVVIKYLRFRHAGVDESVHRA